MKKYFFKILILFSLAIFPLLYAAGPQWWIDRDVIDSTKQADDYAVANIGQLKYIAKRAADELNENLPQGAGAQINNMILAWSNPPEEGIVRDDYAVLTIGQLKAVGKLFYDRLGMNYPWQITGADESHDAAANIGQLKTVFSFEIPENLQTPDVPGYLDATVNGGKVTLTWSNGNNGNQVNYIIERREKNGEWEVIGTISDLSYVDENIQSGKEYEYRIKAILGDYTSEYSSIFELKTSGISINIISPSDKKTVAWNEGVSVKISVMGAVSWGTVDSIALYRDDFLVGTLTEMPYEFDFSVLEPGTYQLYAKALSGSSVLAVSRSLSLTVVAQSSEDTTTVHSPSYGAFYTMIAGATENRMENKYFSLPLSDLALWQGEILSVEGNKIFLKLGDEELLSAGIFNAEEDRFYVEVIASESNPTGSVLDISENDERSLTCIRNIEDQLKAGDLVSIRKHRTLGGLFGVNNEIGLKGGEFLDATDPRSDIIDVNLLTDNGSDMIADSSAFFYYNTNQGWSLENGVAHNPIIYPDKGFNISRCADSTNSIRYEHVGVVRSWKSQTSLFSGYFYNIQRFMTGNLFTLPLSSFSFDTGDPTTGVTADKKAFLTVFFPDGGFCRYEYKMDSTRKYGWAYISGTRLEYRYLVPPGSCFSYYNTVSGVDFRLTLPRGN